MKKKGKQQEQKRSSSSPSTKKMDSPLTSMSKSKTSKVSTSRQWESPLMVANGIVNSRSEERDREYGGFTVGMIKTAKIATELCGKEITPDDAFKVMMALKLSRLAHSPKFDSMVDLIGYTEGWWNYIQEHLELIKQNQADWQDILTTAAGIKPSHTKHCECKICRNK